MEEIKRNIWGWTGEVIEMFDLKLEAAQRIQIQTKISWDFESINFGVCGIVWDLFETVS